MPPRTRKKTYRRKRYRKTYRKKRYRKKKLKSYYDKTRKTQDARLSISRLKKLTLSKRVRILETETKKHWDWIQLADSVPHKINWNGETYTGSSFAARNSFPQLFAIQQMDTNGDIPRVSAQFTAKEANCRRGQTVFVTKARLRGTLNGLIPRVQCTNLGGTAGPPDPTTGVLPLAGLLDSDIMHSQAANTDIWMIVIQDKFPGIVKENGVTEPNPPPDAYDGTQATEPGKSPLENLAAFTHNQESTLETQGYPNMLRSYDCTRFTVKMAKCFKTTANNPTVNFDVTINVNKTLRYVLDEGEQVNQTPTQPYNYNLYVYFISDHINKGFADMTKYHAPQIIRLSQRVYFKDN